MDFIAILFHSKGSWDGRYLLAATKYKGPGLQILHSQNF